MPIDSYDPTNVYLAQVTYQAINASVPSAGGTAPTLTGGIVYNDYRNVSGLPQSINSSEQIRQIVIVNDTYAAKKALEDMGLRNL
jgi:hypothetical protein